MLVTGIKSKPLFRPLRFDATGTTHVAVGQAAGREAVLRLAAEVRATGAGCVVLLACDGTDEGTAALPPALRCDSDAELFDRLDALLARLSMGTRLYAAGSESFLARVRRLAELRGLGVPEIQCEQVGPPLRRVYCIHCRTTNDGVAAEFADCAGCGRRLLVRDHFSRRLAAYMGVMADAETPARKASEDL